MKKIIQRNLPLDVKYNLIDKKYISLIDGSGTCCANCNKPIANIATVKGGDKTYNIGFDCLETLLINTKLLDGESIENYNQFKKSLPTFLKRAKEINETVDLWKGRNFKIDYIEVEVNDFYKGLEYYKPNEQKYLTYYICVMGKRFNSNFQIKSSSNIKDFIEVLKSITKVKINEV